MVSPSSRPTAVTPATNSVPLPSRPMPAHVAERKLVGDAQVDQGAIGRRRRGRPVAAAGSRASRPFRVSSSDPSGSTSSASTRASALSAPLDGRSPPAPRAGGQTVGVPSHRPPPGRRGHGQHVVGRQAVARGEQALDAALPAHQPRRGAEPHDAARVLGDALHPARIAQRRRPAAHRHRAVGELGQAGAAAADPQAALAVLEHGGDLVVGQPVALVEQGQAPGLQAQQPRGVGHPQVAVAVLGHLPGRARRASPAPGPIIVDRPSGSTRSRPSLPANHRCPDGDSNIAVTLVVTGPRRALQEVQLHAPVVGRPHQQPVAAAQPQPPLAIAVHERQPEVARPGQGDRLGRAACCPLVAEQRRARRQPGHAVGLPVHVHQPRARRQRRPLQRAVVQARFVQAGGAARPRARSAATRPAGASASWCRTGAPAARASPAVQPLAVVVGPRRRRWRSTGSPRRSGRWSAPRRRASRRACARSAPCTVAASCPDPAPGPAAARPAGSPAPAPAPAPQAAGRRKFRAGLRGHDSLAGRMSRGWICRLTVVFVWSTALSCEGSSGTDTALDAAVPMVDAAIGRSGADARAPDPAHGPGGHSSPGWRRCTTRAGPARHRCSRPASTVPTAATGSARTSC